MAASRIIAFSLWGDDAVYTEGALANARLAETLYPGWRCRFYVGTTVPDAIVARLAERPNVELVLRAEPGDWRAALWRFQPAFEEGDVTLLVRDADSRLGERERVAVEAWLASENDLHIMRDHPFHTVPILGGMWGVRRGLLAPLRARYEAHRAGDYWQCDQEFLAAHVYPFARGEALEHDEFSGGAAFPRPRRGLEFVGEPLDDRDRPRDAAHRRVLAEALAARRIG